MIYKWLKDKMFATWNNILIKQILSFSKHIVKFHPRYIIINTFLYVNMMYFEMISLNFFFFFVKGLHKCPLDLTFYRIGVFCFKQSIFFYYCCWFFFGKVAQITHRGRCVTLLMNTYWLISKNVREWMFAVVSTLIHQLYLLTLVLQFLV